MNARLKWRIVLSVLTLVLLNIYVTMRVMVVWPWGLQHPSAVCLGGFVFLLLQLLAPVADRVLFTRWRKKPVLRHIVWLADFVSYTAFGLLPCLFIYLLLADVIHVVLAFAHIPFSPGAYNGYVRLALCVVVPVTVVLGIYGAVAKPRVVRVDVPLKGLPRGFEGFTIAQVSDLHVGPTIKRGYVQSVVEMVNALKPDLIALTGDLVDGYTHDLAAEIAPIGQLKAAHGTFYVTGNHEYYWGGIAWAKAFEALGIKVLLNSHVIIRHKGGELVLAGIPDHTAARFVPEHAPDPHKALAGAPAAHRKILLAHQPVSYAGAHAAGFNLQLSGHTHGGQYFPFNLLIRFFQRYYKGLNRHENMWVYVSRGTGYWGPPLRVGAPSEVTLITLRQA